MTKRSDEVLAALDGLIATTAEDYVPKSTGTVRCWRCNGAPGDGPSGICQPCREILLAEIPVEARDHLLTELDLEPWQLDVLRGLEHWGRAAHDNPT